MRKKMVAITLLSILVNMACYAATVDLRILETTDLHGNMMDYDYYQDKTTDRFGLTRTATLIHQTRTESRNTILVDNGDLLQGSPLADYVASKGLKDKEIHPVFKALNSLNYTVGGLGNHEFNYGLDFLAKALAGAKYPIINSNVYDAKTGKHYFTPYVILETPVVDREGKNHYLKIGYISFVPPQIMDWDRKHLAGKVTVSDITQTAKELVPELKRQGADLIIAIAHSGISSDPYQALAENSVYYLSEVPNINAILFGHTHAVFPSESFRHLKKADISKGTINGIPAVMPGQWGDHLGVVDLVIDNRSGAWEVLSGRSEARPIFDLKAKKPTVEADQDLTTLLHSDHQDTLTFTNQPIGYTQKPIKGYLALVQDDDALQLINEAQIAYTQHYIQGDPDLKDLPVIAAVAPFKAGGRKNAPTYYIDIDAGQMSFRNAADLYIYENTLTALKITGHDLGEWLECAAGMFNQIDVTHRQPQYLLNWDYRTYNFDIIDGINYQIDITQPARYDNNCKLINPNAHRITHLTYQNKPIANTQSFIIATNNYRALTGIFPGTGESNVAFNSPMEVRTIVIDYIKKQSKQAGAINVTADHNWRLAPITKAKIPLDIRVETSPIAENFINAQAQYPMTYLDTDNIGFAVYRIDLQQPAKF